MTPPLTTRPGNAVRPQGEVRARILQVAMKLLAERGRDAVTTRAVAEAAGVQPPILYRLFGDKRGLLDAVAEHGFTAYLSQKDSLPRAADPVEALRAGWDLHIDFGLTSPAIYLLMYAEPSPGKKSSAAQASFAMLREHIRRVASAGRLRVSETRAANLFHAAGSGTVLTLLGMPPGKLDMTLSALAREAALAAITTEVPINSEPIGSKPGSAKAAITLRAVLDGATSPLSRAEHSLLVEWLDRLAAQ